MKTQADYFEGMRSLVKDLGARLDDPADHRQALDNATLVFSRLKPRYCVRAYDADGTRIYGLPADWDSELSGDYDFRVEYPVDESASQPIMLDPEMFDVYLKAATVDGDPAVQKLRFNATMGADFVPTSGTTFNLHYRAAHIITDTVNTVPDTYFYALTKLAASELCKMLAARYAPNSSASLSDSGANYGTQSDKFLSLAKTYYKDYMDAVAPNAEEIGPAFTFGGFVDTPLHHRPYPTFPRNSDGRKDVYN